MTAYSGYDWKQPEWATGALILADGTVFWAKGAGSEGVAVGEVCFNTSMTGYQEIITDPSYAGQIITFTFPHIGNVGVNPEDYESTIPATRGCIFRSTITKPANWRSTSSLDLWLKKSSLVAISDLDTRQLTNAIRTEGTQAGVIVHQSQKPINIDEFLYTAQSWPGLVGMDLAKEVTCRNAYVWNSNEASTKNDYEQLIPIKYHIVAIDYGAKQNILRCFANLGCRITVLPASATSAEIFSHNPDGIFLSNGPGDPVSTGSYAVPMIKELISSGLPVFGICLGHQMMALALGAKTEKMHHGHHGANHPVKNLISGRVEITSQNHGFVVADKSLPTDLIVTHRSLFDNSLEGLRLKDKPVFSVQYHPESSPGPHDSRYLFELFLEMIDSKE